MFGSFGATRASLLETDFYSFFHLAAVGRSARPGGATITHRPTGRFGPLVTLDVRVTPTDDLAGLTLRVDRSFVEHPRDGVFARDVVGSFVREGADGEGHADGIAALLDELRTRPLTGPRNADGKPAYTDENPLPPCPARAGDFGRVFTVYCGSDAAFVNRLAATYLSVSNDHVGGTGVFTAEFVPVA